MNQFTKINRTFKNNMAKQLNPMWLTLCNSQESGFTYIRHQAEQALLRLVTRFATVHVSESLKHIEKFCVSYSHRDLQRPVCLCVTVSSFSNGQPHREALRASYRCFAAQIQFVKCSVTAVRGLFWLSFDHYVHGKVLYKKIQAFSVLSKTFWAHTWQLFTESATHFFRVGQQK